MLFFGLRFLFSIRIIGYLWFNWKFILIMLRVGIEKLYYDL